MSIVLFRTNTIEESAMTELRNKMLANKSDLIKEFQKNDKNKSGEFIGLASFPASAWQILLTPAPTCGERQETANATLFPS